MKNKMKQAFCDSYLQCLLTSLTFGLIGPMTLFLGNQDEFEFGIGDIFPILFLCTAVLFAALLAVCMLIKNRKIRAVVTACVLGVGIGFYVQGNFMSGGYGQLNGQEIDWSSMQLRGIVNTIIWLACIAVPAVLAWRAKKKYDFQKICAGVLLAIELLACVILLFTSGPFDSDTDNFTVTTEDAFTLSDKQNVVVFLLDNFSSPLFEEIVTEDRAYYDAQFDGFTFFPDTVGVGCTTKGSLPFILTGMWNENQYIYSDYLNIGYDNELYNTLEKLDYDTRLFVGKNYVGSESIHFFDNMIDKRTQIDTGKVTKLMYKLTGFTYMPHFLKPTFWLYSGDFSVVTQDTGSSIQLFSDPQFYKSLNEYGVTVDKDYKGAYRFYYLSGAHAPFDMNENAEAVESGSVTMKQRGQGALKIVSTYLEQLKAQGIYDKTMVVVLADHGNWEADIVFNPMLFVKPFDSEVEGLSFSNAPITYEDLMPTLLYAVTGETVGTTVFDVEENAQRTRRFLYYDWNGDWEADYLPELYEYEINGNIRSEDSRTPTGRVFTKDGIITNSIEYTLGTEVFYNSANAGGQTYVNYGMYYPEETHTFTRGSYTEWKFPLADYTGGNLKFTINIAAVQGGVQRVQFSVNGQFVKDITADSSGALTFLIPEALIADGTLEIRLDFPDASASESDSRIRSLAIQSVVLDYAEEYRLGQKLGYTAASAEEKFVIRGLYAPEESHTFTSGNYTEWMFPLAAYTGGNLKFTIEVVEVRGDMQRVQFSVDGHFLEEVIVESAGNLSFTVPEELISEGTVEIRLDFPDAAASEGDARVRALAIRSALLDYVQ